MVRQRTELVGRREELDALRRERHGAALLVVRGVAGSGKSAVLGKFRDELRAAGAVVLDVAGTFGHPAWDLFGVEAILAAVRAQYERLDSDPRLADSINAVSRLCTADGYSSSWRKFCLRDALTTLFTRVSANGPITLIVDDADRISQPMLTLAAVHRAGHLVVASYTAGSAAEPAELCTLADQVIDLGPLAEEDVDSLLRQVAGMPVDDVVPTALRENLGPLCGNPGTLVSTMADLRARRRLVGVHGHLCLRDPGEPIVLPAGQELLTEVAVLGDLGRDLVILAVETDGFGVDEIPVLATATQRSSLDVGQAADRLVLSGVLDSDARGRLRCCCRALGAAVTGQAGEDVVRLLHRRMAEQLLHNAERGDRRSVSIVAGHIAMAGRSLPAKPELAALLSKEVSTILDPVRRAVYLHAAWWHCDVGAGRARLRSQLVRLLVRSASYPRLADFVAEVVADIRPDTTLDADERDNLAMAASLAAIHCGRPVPEFVRTALIGPGGALRPFQFCERWFEGASPRLDELVSGFMPAWLRDDSSPPTIAGRTRHRRQPDATLEKACEIRNLIPVFESVLGSDYRAPTDGPLAAYHQVCRGYAEGVWAEALSAARQLELTVNADVFSRQGASLLAAEMCGWRGEDRWAASWLASVPEVGALTVLRAWVAAGLRDHNGDVAGALEVGWAGYRRDERPGVVEELGSSLLLRRLAAISMEAGESHWARRVLNEVEARHESLDTAESFETALFVRGLVEGDGARARAAERFARQRGNRFELALACQLAGSTSNEPQLWMYEAYEIAQAIGAARLTAKTKRSMETCGVVVPVTRARREHLSDIELRIIALIRQGKTNRQIAIEVRMSEKTVEKHLTRLFVKAGCRTRHGLATSGLGGRLESVGA